MKRAIVLAALGTLVAAGSAAAAAVRGVVVAAFVLVELKSEHAYVKIPR